MDSRTIESKVSVIIPIYNVEQYLHQCIDSVISQTLREIEIILVDDGSTDRSGCICDEYAAKDKRIKVIHKANQGLSCARNDGIDISTAQFIMFVDGDDWVEPQFCELPYRIAVEENVDIVLITHNRVFKGNRMIPSDLEMYDSFISETEALNYNVRIANAAWLALYRRQLFECIKFPSGRVYEDVGVVHRLIHKAHSHYLICKPLYNHRVCRSGSITTDSGIKYYNDRKEMFRVRIKDLLDWGYEDLAQELAISMLIKYGTREEYFKSVVKHSSKIKPKSLRQRLMLLIFRLSPVVFDAICVLLRRREKIIT